MLIGADLGRALLVLSLLWPQGAWHAYVVAAGLATGNTFFNPAVQAVIPALTTEEQRLAANSVAWSTGRLVQIVASAAAGRLIGLLDVTWSLLRLLSLALGGLLVDVVGVRPLFWAGGTLLVLAGLLRLALLGRHDFRLNEHETATL